MTSEAKRLERLQKEERGLARGLFNGKPVKAPGPYVSTPEREARAREIIRLRRQVLDPGG